MLKVIPHRTLRLSASIHTPLYNPFKVWILLPATPWVANCDLPFEKVWILRLQSKPASTDYTQAVMTQRLSERVFARVAIRRSRRKVLRLQELQSLPRTRRLGSQEPLTSAWLFCPRHHSVYQCVIYHLSSTTLALAALRRKPCAFLSFEYFFLFAHPSQHYSRNCDRRQYARPRYGHRYRRRPTANRCRARPRPRPHPCPEPVKSRPLWSMLNRPYLRDLIRGLSHPRHIVRCSCA